MREPAFDIDEALDRCGGDRELLQDMARLFAQQSGKLMTQVKEALTCGNAKALEQSAHKLKGSIGNFSAARAFAAAQRLEELGRGGDLTQSREAHAHLEEAVTGLQAALAELTAEQAIQG